MLQLDFVYDTLLVEYRNNKTLPEWAHDVFPGGKFETLRNMAFIMDTQTKELKRLQAGPFIQQMLSDMEMAASSSKTGETKKMFMYSAHDTTISFVLNSLGMFNGLVPPYASLLIVELIYKSGWKVRFLYKNSSTQAPYTLTVPNCSVLCPLDKFSQLTIPIRPVNWDAECQSQIFFLTGRLILLLVILTFLIFSLCKTIKLCK